MTVGLEALVPNWMNPIGWTMIALGGGLEVAGGMAQSGLKQHADGGVYSSPSLSAYSGGVYDSPQFFKFANGGVFGEAGPEAIMPLTTTPSGKLGVQAVGGGGGTNVTIINATGASVQTKSKDGANGGRELQIMIGQIVNDHLAQGRADRVMGSRYGLGYRGRSQA